MHFGSKRPQTHLQCGVEVCWRINNNVICDAGTSNRGAMRSSSEVIPASGDRADAAVVALVPDCAEKLRAYNLGRATGRRAALRSACPPIRPNMSKRRKSRVFLNREMRERGANIANSRPPATSNHQSLASHSLHIERAKMSTILRTLRNLRRVGIKVCICLVCSLRKFGR